MLQEQQQQLQQMLGGLADTLKVMTSRIDSEADATRKAFADQRLLVSGIGDTVRVLREKADDTNVRLSTMTQELQALRQTVASMPPPSGAPATTNDPAAGDPAAPAGAPGGAPGASNISPTRMTQPELGLADVERADRDAAGCGVLHQTTVCGILGLFRQR